jgi:hypothetical protein
MDEFIAGHPIVSDGYSEDERGILRDIVIHSIQDIKESLIGSVYHIGGERIRTKVMNSRYCLTPAQSVSWRSFLPSFSDIL